MASHDEAFFADGWLTVVMTGSVSRALASEGIVTLGVTVYVCPPSHLYHVSTARRISLGGKGNALYPVLCSYFCCFQCV